jgi:predicted esterase
MYKSVRYSGILIISIILAFTACKNSVHKLMKNEAVELTDSCSTGGAHHYRVYIPSVKSGCDAMPLVLIIDPHAAAKPALHRFIAGAEKYKYILVASASLKNNYLNFAQAINQLLTDVRAKYPVSATTYIAGFSGGGRMALSYAQYMHVDGVIACGALAPPEQLAAIKSPVIAFAGIADFNFIEAAQYIFRPEETPKNLRLEVTEDTHDWPSGAILSNALGYLHAAEKELNPCCKEKVIFRNFASGQKARIDSLRKAGDFLSAGLIARNLANLEDFSKYDDFISIRNSIEYSSDFNKALGRLRESIRFELKVRNAYYAALQSNDASWWKNEITSLNEKLKSGDELFMGFAYKRIKGFLGITCYSLCGNTLQSGDLKNAARLLSIYKLVEPGNPDMYYDYALFYQKTHVTDSVPKFLTYAIKAGFSDKQKLLDDFPSEFIQGILYHNN